MAVTTTPSRFSLSRARVSENFYGYLFIMPFIIGLMVFTVFSFGASFVLSFTRYNIFAPPEWVGLQNYYNMFFNDARFWQSFRNTVYFTFVSVPIRLVFSLGIAMIMLKAGSLSSFYRLVYYLPSIMGGSIAVALMWRRIMASDGAINSFINSTFGTNVVISWVFDPRTAMWTLIMLAIWQFGGAMLIFLAGLKQIPASYYEAAVVDGANSWQKFIRITIPLLTPVIFFNLIMGLIGSMQAFTSSFVVTGGRPFGMTRFFAMYLYENAFEFGQMGYASAMAWFMFVIIAIMTAIVFKSAGGWVFYEGGK